MVDYGANVIPAMTSNTAPAGHTINFSSENNPEKAYRACDHVVANNNYWFATEEEIPQYLEYHNASSRVIRKYTITTIDVGSQYVPNEWTMRGSNDGGAGTAYDTVTGQSFANSTTYEFECATHDAYTYDRLNVTRLGHGAGVTSGLLAFTEWTIHEEDTGGGGGEDTVAKSRGFFVGSGAGA